MCQNREYNSAAPNIYNTGEFFFAGAKVKGGDYMKRLNHVFPVIVLILSCVFSAFLVLDFCNPAMNLVDTKVSHLLLWAFCILSIICTVNRMYEQRRQEVLFGVDPQEWC